MSRMFYAKTGVEINDNLTDNLLALKGEIRPKMVEAVLVVAERIRQLAHDYANVSPRVIGHAEDGRHMRDTIEIVLIEDATSVTAKIGIDMNNVPYAAHQEFGPRGKPFLRPAVDEVRAEAHVLMRDAMQGVPVHTLVRFRRFA